MSLADHLNAIARDGRTPNEERENWYPSDIGNCDRKTVLHHAGIPYDLSDETVRVFWLGDVIHEAVQRGMSRRFPGDIWHEVEVRDATYRFSGRIDSLHRFSVVLPGDGLEVFEYKSIKTLAFAHELPKKDNVLQSRSYLIWPPTCPACCRAHDHTEPFPHSDKHCDPAGCDICGFTGKLRVPTQTRLFYISKDGHERPAEFVISADSVESEKIKAMLLDLEAAFQRYLSTGELPPPLPQVPSKIKGVAQTYVKTGPWGKAGDPKLVDDWHLNYCDYRGTGLCCAEGATHHVKGVLSASKAQQAVAVPAVPEADGSPQVLGPLSTMRQPSVTPITSGEQGSREGES